MSMNQFFNYLEKSILVVILISTVVAFATVILGLFEAGTVELADILLLFILLEIFGMKEVIQRNVLGAMEILIQDILMEMEILLGLIFTILVLEMILGLKE